MDKLKRLLQLDTKEIKAAKILKEKSIDYAVSLPGGSSVKEKKYHTLWKSGKYEVGVGKPGKEAERKNPNINDMWPYIKKNGVFDEQSASFSQIFMELEHMGNKSPHALELLGCLLSRSAYMLDHEILADDVVVYKPPKLIMDEISKEINKVFNVPLPVFLQYLDAIALNEDVKYQRRLNSNGKAYSKSAGRQNNLLTCAHLIAVILKRASIVRFASGFAQQRGVSAISTKQIISCFPMLDIDKEEAKIISKEAEI
ncbi:MAG: hypothetical protein Q8Q48_02345 [Candidatus Staskawiczbacteria bacterium]|nr:hypothetical protein [Candidatus Staskawiczbacteria bacterium]